MKVNGSLGITGIQIFVNYVCLLTHAEILCFVLINYSMKF